MARGGRRRQGRGAGGALTRPFSYQRAGSLSEAAALLALPGAAPLGGGTDLLVSIEEGIAAPSPSTLVDLRGVRGGDAIEALPDGGASIGACALLHDIANEALIADRFPALAQACAVVGSSALRNMGTLGGNLCQRPRCWYFRRAVPCFKNGGDSCPAREGENQYLAILDGGPCYIVHPSDPAVALTALDARVEVIGEGSTREIPLAEFYALPADRMDHETVLRGGEFVGAILLPPSASGERQLYRKLMQREAWDFALVSIAAARHADGTVRLALGGVAPRPWRLPTSVEEDVAAGGLDEDSISALAERALYDAEPLAKNGYKVELAASLIRDAIRELGS
ncbi:MAG: FAD binding domain-containing protein [Gemmatimonadaceae bacterium]